MYDKSRTLTRPVLNSSHPIQVYYGVRLLKLDIDETTQTLITNVWVRMVSFKNF